MKPRILFVHNHAAKFVQMDLAILRENYVIREWHQRSRAVNLPALIRAVAQSDLVFGWFASWHTLFPVLLARALHRPSVLVVGGYDSANLPDAGYGNMRGGFKRWVSRTTMQAATRLVTNSQFTKREVMQNAGVAAEKISVVYHGFIAPPPTSAPKEKMVLTVGNVLRENLKRKGIEPFVRAAARLPDVPFVVVGKWGDDSIDELKRIAAPNVQFTNGVDADTLQNYFQRASVYVQASRHEGFGMAVAEAMLHQCVPVVTRAGALPEVVGDCGIYMDSAEPRSVAEGIRQALAADGELGRRAHVRIAREFPLSRRSEQLYALIDSLTLPTR